MSGLDKITARILEESADKAQKITDEAVQKAKAITADGQKKTAEECERIGRKAEAVARSTEEKGQTSAQLRHKQILLSGRQELIHEVIDTARRELGSLNDAEYKEFIIKLFNRHLPSQDAKLLLSEQDKNRLGADTLEALKSAALANDSKLTIADEAADIKNGFVLSYGGVEENCTIDALLDQSMDDMQDKVKDILF